MELRCVYLDCVYLGSEDIGMTLTYAETNTLTKCRVFHCRVTGGVELRKEILDNRVGIADIAVFYVINDSAEFRHEHNPLRVVVH